MEDRANATRILEAIEAGDESAAQRLLPLVYEQLRALAGSYFRDQAARHTLQPTALVHEAFVKLVDGSGATYRSRSHFMAVAATAMRQILADHARSRKTAKRGDGWDRVTLDQAADASTSTDVDLVDLDEALAQLAQLDERHARIVQLRFFGGLSMQEIADVLGVSRTTADNDWRVARAWLNARLSGGREE